MNIFSNLFDCLKRRRGVVLILGTLTILSIVLGVISAINFNGGIIVIDFNNVTYIKFLQNDGSVGMLIFGSLLSVGLFYLIVLLCCSKKFLLPLAILFYLYLIYSQAVVITSVLLIYGLFNTLILLLVLIIYVLALAFAFILLICQCIEICGMPFYFRSCFNKNSGVLVSSIMLLAIIFVFCLIVWILKSYVILLVF